MKTLEIIGAIIKALISFWHGHGTKILGLAATVVSTALLVPDFIPEPQMKWWLFANALLGGGVVKRGFTNTHRQDERS